MRTIWISFLDFINAFASIFKLLIYRCIWLTTHQSTNNFFWKNRFHCFVIDAVVFDRRRNKKMVCYSFWIGNDGQWKSNCVARKKRKQTTKIDVYVLCCIYRVYMQQRKCAQLQQVNCDHEPRNNVFSIGHFPWSLSFNKIVDRIIHSNCRK